MKTTRNLALAIVTFSALAALSLFPTFAFAETENGSNAPDAAIADSGESGGVDAAPATASGDGIGGDAQASPSQGGGVPDATEGGASADSGFDSEAAVPPTSENDSDGDSIPAYGDDAVDSAPATIDANGETGADNHSGSSDDHDGETDNSGNGTTADGELDDAQGSADGSSAANDAMGENPSGPEDAGMRIEDGNVTDFEAGSDDEGAPVEIAEAGVSAQVDNDPGAEEGLVNAAKEGSTPTLPAAIGSEDSNTSEAARLIAQSAGELGDSFGPLEIAIAKNLIEGALYGSASGTFSWTASHLLTSLFGGVVDDDTQAKLREILEKLDEIETSITTLKTNVERIQIQNIMNELKYLFGDPTVYTAYKALQDVEDDLAAKKITPEQAKTARLKALTKTINITEAQWGTINTDFDQYVNRMWNAMTGPWDVTVEDQRQQMTLMQTHYELLRRSYKWEHQSYDEWSFFQGRCVSLLMATLTLERASLQARIDLLVANDRKDEAYGVGERLDLVNDWIKQAAGYKVVLPDGVQVVYPGFFSDETWAAQYWMFKKRDDSERYYWVPGHEIVFYAEVNTQHVPQENKNGGLDYPKTLDGLNWYSNGTPYPKFSFWKPFVRYQGGDTLLASAAQLKAIYKDYGSSTHLYTIFMDEKEGNFQGLDIDGNSTWWFVVDPDSDHSLEYCPHFFSADRLRCYVLSSGGASTDTAILCYYHNQYTEPNHHTHYIGVGVKRVGPEVYNPNGNKEEPQPHPEFYTAVVYPDDWAQWWPSHGGLALGFEAVTHGDIDRVLVDGELLDPSQYAVADGMVVLSGAYLASLGYGEHEFFLDTEGGGHTVTFSTQADGVYYAESGEGAAWTAGSGDGLTFVFKRTTDDYLTFTRLIDVLVDGTSVPAWGYVASAGSAIVTLTAAFLDTLAPGLHTLTAVFEDGNNPQATFTVNAAGTLPAHATGAAAPGQAEQTPRTSDDAALPTALIAAIALASSLVAARARKAA